MAEEKSGPVETGAEMDYTEHEKTYDMFLALTKYGTLLCVAIIIGMAIGFFTTAGVITASLITIIICAVGYYTLG